MPNFPEAGVRLVAETQDAYDAVESLASVLDEVTAGTYSVSVEAEMDTSGLDVSELPVDGETITETVDIEQTDTAQASLDALNFLKNTKIIETVWNIVGTGVDLIQKFGGSLLQPMLDLDQAVANVNARTGEAIPNARTLIKDIFYDDLGESVDQVGQLIIQAHGLGAPLQEATTAALTFTHAFTDQNPQQVLNTMNQLVVNKLTPDFKTAGDVLVTAFQNGADRGGDLLNALNDNANAIHNMGLTGPEALSFIKTGLDNGFNSATQVLNILEKIKQNVTNAAGNPTSDVSKTLRQLGIANPAETGEAWSADFFKAVIDKIANAPGLTDTQKETLFSNLAGGKQGGKTFAAFLQLSPEEADTVFANVKGAAERAAQDADDSLSGAFADFQLAVAEKVDEVLSSEAIDIPGKIKLLKEGLQQGLDELAAGGSLSDALTIALTPIGLGDEFAQLESTFGNLVISLLQVAKSIQEISGQGKAAEGTQNVILKLSQQQLAFDLKVNNPEDLQLAIETAASRGLSSSQVSTQVSNVVSDLINTGTTEALKQAQTIIDTLKKPIDQNTVPTLASGAPMNVEPVVTDEALTALQEKVNMALKEAPPPDVIDELSTQMGLLDTATRKVSTSATETKNPLDKVTDATRKLGGMADETNHYVRDTSNELVTVNANLQTTTVALGGFNTALQETLDKAGAVSSTADTLAKQQAASQGAAVNPDTGAGPHAMGGIDSTALVGEGGQEIVSSNKDFAILNHKTTQAIMGAVYAFMNGTSSMASGGGNTFIASNTNYIQSEAQADALGYQTAASLRGMSNV